MCSKVLSTSNPQFSTTIDILKVNNGIEYMFNNMSHYLNIHGIIQQTSWVGKPQQNDIIERKKNCDLL